MTKMLVGAFVLCLIFACVPPVYAQTTGTTYYIDAQAGLDSNSGTSQAAPWKTLTKVNSTVLVPGDTMLFKRGQRWDGSIQPLASGTATNPITYGAYGTGAKPIIYGNKKEVFTWSLYSGNIWQTTKRANIVTINNQPAVHAGELANLDKPYEIFKDEGSSDGNVYIYSPSEPNGYYGNNFEIGFESSVFGIDANKYLIVENLELVGGKYYVVYISGGGNAIIRNNTMRNVYNNGVFMRNSSNNLIQGNTISNGNSFGIKADVDAPGVITSNNRVIGNTVSGFSYSGIVLNGYSGEFRSTNNEVSDNISFNNGDGVYLHYLENSVIARNRFYENIREESAGEGYGIGLQTVSTTTISENSLYRNRTRGIEVWGGDPSQGNFRWGASNGNKIVRNRIWENTLDGILLSSQGFVDNTIIAYNAVYNNLKMGILISDEGNTGTQIVNNTTYGNKENTLFYYENAKPVIKNNLFANGTSVTIYSTSDNGNNAFSNDSLRWNGSTVAPNLITTQNSTYLVSTADFVNTATGDFSLKTGSPFINKGVSVAYTTDLRGAPIVGLPDIGAFEFGSGLLSPTVVATVQPTATNVPTTKPTTTATPTTYPTCTMFIKGDSNCDGKINIFDGQVVIQSTSAGVYDIKADFNKDGLANKSDISIWVGSYGISQ